MTNDQPQPLRGRIASITVRGFRSLAKVEDLQLPQLVVLIGANGSGKSNLIRFFQMLGWMLRGQNLQEFVLRQGGGDDQLFMGARTTPRLDAEIHIETRAGRNDYRFALSHVAGDTLMLVDEAYRFSAWDGDGLNQWHTLTMPAKEASIADQMDTDPTARVIVRLLRSCPLCQDRCRLLFEEWTTHDGGMKLGGHPAGGGEREGARRATGRSPPPAGRAAAAHTGTTHP